MRLSPTLYGGSLKPTTTTDSCAPESTSRGGPGSIYSALGPQPEPTARERFLAMAYLARGPAFFISAPQEPGILGVARVNGSASDGASSCTDHLRTKNLRSRQPIGGVCATIGTRGGAPACPALRRVTDLQSNASANVAVPIDTVRPVGNLVLSLKPCLSTSSTGPA
jgi:hypothetical protein